MDPSYARQYRFLYENHWWWRAREEFLVERLRKLGLSGSDSPILDVGCGDGLFFERLREFGKPEGVEPHSEIVTPLGTRYGEIHQCLFDGRFQPDHRYSAILFLDVLEHLPDDVAALKHAASLLEPGGRIVIAVPAIPWLWTSHDNVNYHFRRYTRTSLRRATEAADLVLDECRYIDHWTVPAKLLIKLKESVRPTSGAGPRMPPVWINRFLWRMTNLEHRALGWCRLPIGTSLWAVARMREPAGAHTRKQKDAAGAIGLDR